MLQVPIKRLTATALVPKRMSEHAAGYDLFADLTEIVELKPGTLKLIPTGIAIALPEGYEAQIRPRSGLASKFKIGVLNSPGTIDADYRGEIQVILYNFGEEAFLVEPQMRIAQMIVSKHEVLDLQLSESLTETGRGDGGFGHTHY